MKVSRRSFLLKIFFGIVGVLFFDAFWFERFILEWNIFNISNNEENKLKAIQLSDLHLEKIKSCSPFFAERINKEQPDVLFLTGDTITRSSRIAIIEGILIPF